MNRKTLMFLVISGFLLAILAISYLVGTWEEGAKAGYAQIVFIAGVVSGMVTELIITRIDQRIPK